MSGPLSKWLKTCSQQFLVRDEDPYDESRALANAQHDLQVAHRLFEFATEPELVDYAIYSLKAAEKQYVYLWKRARQQC